MATTLRLTVGAHCSSHFPSTLCCVKRLMARQIAVWFVLGARDRREMRRARGHNAGFTYPYCAALCMWDFKLLKWVQIINFSRLQVWMSPGVTHWDLSHDFRSNLEETDQVATIQVCDSRPSRPLGIKWAIGEEGQKGRKKILFHFKRCPTRYIRNRFITSGAYFM